MTKKKIIEKRMGRLGLLRPMGPLGLLGRLRPLRPMGLMGLLGLLRPLRLMGLLGLMGLGLAGCSDDADEAPGPRRALGTPVEVTGFASWFDEALTTRRAWTPPAGYEPYSDPEKAIGIVFTKDNADSLQGSFFKSSGKWRTDVVIPTAEPYYLYGYVPHSPGITLSVTDRDGGRTAYSAGAKVELTNVPAIMANDLCVVIGAKDGTGKETVTGLKRGDFCYHAHPISDEGSDAVSNFVFLLFDHLYASLRIRMKVHNEYASLRTIKLKSLKLSTIEDETRSKKKTDITVMLAANDAGTDPITSITYTPRGEDIDDGLEFWSSAGEELTTDYATFVGYFMPQGVTQLVLTSVYDVYDTNKNLIRKDCKATNTMVLSQLITGQTTTLRGRRYTINMTIRPTYLYMLSEPDLDNPTMTVE